MTTPRVEARLWVLTPGWGFSRDLELTAVNLQRRRQTRKTA